MNHFYRIIAFLFFAVGLYYAGLYLFFSETSPSGGFDIPENVQLTKSRSSLIPEEEPLTYTLSQSPETLWISSSAIINDSNSQTIHFPYRIDIQITDKSDELVLQRSFHFQARASKPVRITTTQQELPETFIPQPDTLLADSQNIHLKLPASALNVYVSQYKEDTQIRGIALRVYQKVQRSSRVSAIDLWQRLSSKQQRQLAENFPFERPFLTKSEKANLAEYRWQPLVPQGDEGKHYESQILYRVDRDEIAIKKHQLSQYEHLADVYKRVSFPISTAGLYQLQGQHAFSSRDFFVSMQWFNRKDSKTTQQKLSFTGTGFSHTLELKPGLVTFTASVPVSIDLFSTDAHLEEHKHFSSKQLLLPEEPLQYAISHSDTGPTPLQLQLRGFAEQGKHTGPDAKVTVRQLANGQIIKTDTYAVENYPDEDSQIVSEEFFNWLGSSQKRYFWLDRNIDTLSLISNQPVLVSAHTRLADKPAIRVIPDEKRDWFDYPARVPDWFAIRPVNWAELINKGNIRQVRQYHRSLLAERQTPDPDETYQSLLTDFHQLDMMDIMVENPYFGFPSKVPENTALNFAPTTTLSAEANVSPVTGNDSSRSVNKRWLFIKNTEQPLEIHWRKNGQQHSNFWVAGKWGVVDSDSLFVSNDDRVSFEVGNTTENISWWRNNVPREKARWQQRRAALLEKGTSIKVPHNKVQPTELLSFVVYSTSTAPVTLDISISGTKSSENNAFNTILKRRYKIRANEAYSGFQLSGSRQILARQSFSVPLEADVLPGTLQISVRHAEGDEAFISIVKRALKPKPVLERYRTSGEH